MVGDRASNNSSAPFPRLGLWGAEHPEKLKPQDGIETMANQSATLTQAALTRILKAHRDAGIPVVRTEIGRDGKVVVYSTDRDKVTNANPWDEA